MFFDEKPSTKRRRAGRVGFAPFDALLGKVRDERLGSWRSVEADFLSVVTAFDTEYSIGKQDTGWYQLKGRFFNDLIVDLVENCAGRPIARRAKRPGTLFAAIDLDICYPVDPKSPPIVAGESKIAGTPPHSRNKNVARAGSQDLDKRLREVALNALDVKIANAATRDQSIIDIADWIRRTNPRYFTFWAFRADSVTDFQKAVRRLDALASSYADGVGGFFYEPISPNEPTTYRVLTPPDSLNMERVLSRLCRLIANLQTAR